MMFIDLRDGTGYLQAIVTGVACKTYEALVLQPESFVELYGVLEVVPEGQTVCGLYFIYNLKLNKFYILNIMLKSDQHTVFVCDFL